MSKVISITIPNQLEELLQKEADKTGISRSRFITNILLKWQTDLDTNLNLEKLPNDCKNRNEDGFCSTFHHMCHAIQSEANTCSEYNKGDN